MKPHSKQILDDLTGLAVARGFGKKKRGRAWRVAEGDGDLLQAIAWQPREWPNDVLQVHVFRQVIWDALEREMARGFGLKYALGNFVTASEFVSVARVFTFVAGQSPAGELAAADAMLEAEVIPGFAAISDKAALAAWIAAEVDAGGGYPEKLVLSTLLTEGEAAAEVRYERLCGSVNDFLRARLEGFWATLRA